MSSNPTKKLQGFSDLTKDRDKKPVCRLFLSFDLVGSTKYKQNKANWPKLFTQFYEDSDSSLKRIDPQFSIWKYIGDEVLFSKIITQDDYEKIPEIIQSVNTAFLNVTEEIKKKSEKQLDLKATLWIAKISAPKQENNEQHTDPINLEIPAPYKQIEMNDFLGPAIDLGFRISKFAVKGVLTISADLAYLMLKSKKELPLRIVSFEKLKGIWNDRAYPIIWYFNDWDKIKDNFSYDDHCNNEIIRKGQSNNDVGKAFIVLERIFKELEKEKEIEDVKNTIKNTQPIREETHKPIKRLSEVHCAAIVFFENEALIAKRMSDKRRLPNLWEFGCAQLHNNSFKEAIIDAYKQDFDIKITDVLINKPVTTYEIDDESGSGKKIPGIIFIAYTNSSTVICKKHSEFRWITEADIRRLDQRDFVPNALINLSLAFEIKNSLTKERKRLLKNEKGKLVESDKNPKNSN